MKLLSERSHRELLAQAERATSEFRRLAESNAMLRRRIKELEKNYQELVLRAGIEGFSVEFKPAVPAQPPKLVLKRVRD